MNANYCASSDDIVVVGTYCLPLGTQWNKDLGELMHEVVINLTQGLEEKVRKETGNTGFETHRDDIGMIALSSQTASSSIGKGGHNQWGTLFAQWFGSDHEVQTYGKSLDAVHNVMRALKAGDCTTAFVVAVEKKSDEQNLTDSSVKSIDPTLSVFNWDWQSVYANMAVEYFSKTEHLYPGEDRTSRYKAFYRDLMAMGLNDRFNAGKLPFKDVLDAGKKKASRASFDPLTAFDFADNEMDGACALVLMPKGVADAKGITPLATLHASVSRTNSSEFWSRSNLTEYPALISASKELCEKMGSKACISNEDVSVYSIDTKVTMAGPLVLEGLGVLPHPSIPKIAKAVYKAQDPAYPYKHIVFERKDGSKFVVNPTGGTYVNGNLPGQNGLYQMIRVIENMRGAGKPLPVDGRYAVIHDQSSGGDKQNLVLLEVNTGAKR